MLLLVGALAIVVIGMLMATFFTVEQRTTAIVQRLGKFVREAGPGLHVKVPFTDTVIGRVNLRVQQLDVRIETKTEDNVFVQMVVAVQYFVLPEKVYDAVQRVSARVSSQPVESSCLIQYAATQTTARTHQTRCCCPVRLAPFALRPGTAHA